MILNMLIAIYICIWVYGVHAVWKGENITDKTNVYTFVRLVVIGSVWPLCVIYYLINEMLTNKHVK